MPNSADLVTDLPADFAVFGQGVDTSMAYLLGGTTGQILSKTSGTNMAFTWISNDQGDLTAITGGTGITVTSGTGPIPSVAIDATVATLTGTQTLTNKTLTSPALTTPTISTLTTNGDLVYGTGSGALSRLGIGSSAQVLTVASGVPSWATPAGGGGKVLQVVQSISTGYIAITSTNTFSDANLSASITPTLATSKVLIMVSQQINFYTSTAAQPNGAFARLMRGATAIWNNSATAEVAGQQEVASSGPRQMVSIIYLDSPSTTSATTYKPQYKQTTNSYDHTLYMQNGAIESTITLMEIGA